MVASGAMMAPMASNCQCDLRIIEQGKIYLQFSCMTRQTNFSYITELGPNTDPVHNGSKFQNNGQSITDSPADTDGLNISLSEGILSEDECTNPL